MSGFLVTFVPYSVFPVLLFKEVEKNLSQLKICSFPKSPHRCPNSPLRAQGTSEVTWDLENTILYDRYFNGKVRAFSCMEKCEKVGEGNPANTGIPSVCTCSISKENRLKTAFLFRRPGLKNMILAIVPHYVSRPNIRKKLVSAS